MNLVATSLRPIAPPEKGALERIREIAERDLRPVVPWIDEKGFYPLNVLKNLARPAHSRSIIPVLAKATPSTSAWPFAP